ncbi:hypothetical protein E6H31_07465 [Candidatus Bathyarchaeota archaeon]|nr:MAG: hypothetical protein E6H31_07465 [Candidatus Bathyarchaeota archaeon]
MKLGFGKPKQKATSDEVGPEMLIANRLKELCHGDDDLYRAMSRLMFLDPKKITIPLERVLTEAQDFEAQGNNLRAEVSYRIAGGISLYKSDLAGVNKYFSKAASLAGNSHLEYQTLLKKSSDAVDIARKFYEEFNSQPEQS